ncbi:hypothetical protein [Trinickia diaoshuihuensis]|uniref:hypothetical protein n=1 Tax=Trinickia diaoshuihuensis TaxID=2292265 RepID=UPI000E27FCFE|nr:hypothetical protein [Trinickia diaoshuihuensis]
MTPNKRRLTIVLLIILVGIAPFISVAIAGAIADAHGCRLDEAGIYPCVVGGHDFGELLATMSMAGWAGLLTIPAAISVLMLWGFVELLLVFLRK